MLAIVGRPVNAIAISSSLRRMLTTVCGSPAAPGACQAVEVGPADPHGRGAQGEGLEHIGTASYAAVDQDWDAPRHLVGDVR